MQLYPNTYTVESVTSGHPDKVCDQISDAVLDACLAEDPMSRVAVESFGSHGLLIVGGEVGKKDNEFDFLLQRFGCSIDDHALNREDAHGEQHERNGQRSRGRKPAVPPIVCQAELARPQKTDEGHAVSFPATVDNGVCGSVGIWSADWRMGFGISGRCAAGWWVCDARR